MLLFILIKSIVTPKEKIMDLKIKILINTGSCTNDLSRKRWLNKLGLDKPSRVLKKKIGIKGTHQH